jgi:phosphatidylserine/phosphatidylglycerophosphate/cardiolipin synthase-like enzyme
VASLMETRLEPVIRFFQYSSFCVQISVDLLLLRGEEVMHFSSKKIGGYRVFAVSGTNTVSFAIDFSGADTKGLLGFAVEREDPKENERYFMYGFKIFETVLPSPSENTTVSTFNHPVQSFVWDDFTGKPGRTYTYWFHPLKGKPKNLDRSAEPIKITVKTEGLFTRGKHDVFFNRGVASSQAYARKFNNLPPDKQPTAKKRTEALQWLSRELDEAMLKFIDHAKPGDTLLGCFYEFRYGPVADRLKAAATRGVNVQLIVDAKVNESTDSNGKFHESFPRVENLKLVDAKGLRPQIALLRVNNPSNIQHNKFMVLLKGAAAKPSEVWTGSTNLSEGGIHGQTNVGHWVRDGAVATSFARYWNLLLSDPGSADGDDRTTASKKKKAFREQVAVLEAVPEGWPAIPAGASTIFSPRPGRSVLEMYAKSIDGAADTACITLAFGVNKAFKDLLKDNSAQSAITFLLLEKRDLPKANATTPFVVLKASHNVYQAWGSFLRDPLYQWTRETNAMGLGLNKHVAYIHSKFLLKDPLGLDPIVVTGSANFSDPSTNDNDENMLLIRGNQRVADIYFTEFNRLFFHYYFRSVQEALFGRKPTEANAAANSKSSLFLREDDSWLKDYRPGKLKRKRMEMFARMANPVTL